MKRLFMVIFLVAPLTPLAHASGAVKLASVLKNTAIWGGPLLAGGIGFYFDKYPHKLASILEKCGIIHSFKNFDELYTAYKFDEFVTLLNRKENSKPIYFVDKSISNKQKPITLTSFGWLLTSASFNDLVTKNPDSISPVEKAARFNMSLEYNTSTMKNDTLQTLERVAALSGIAALQHTAHNYAISNINSLSWLKNPKTLSQKLFAPIAIGGISVGYVYAQLKCIDRLKVLQSKREAQNFVGQLCSFNKTLLPAYARMAEEFNFPQEEQDVLKKAVAEMELHK